MKIHNNNKTITQLALPERLLPILVDSKTEDGDGFMPPVLSQGDGVVKVRRLMPAFAGEILGNSDRRQEIEKEYGRISQTEWDHLESLLRLIERINSGDCSPIFSGDANEGLEELSSLLDEISGEGWVAEKSDPGDTIMRLRSVSGETQLEIDISVQRSTTPAEVNAHKAIGSTEAISHNETTVRFPIRREVQTAAFTLSKAFTHGLSRTRFVIWWSALGMKLVPGLYCPDIVTALYACILSAIGIPGGIGVCQKCGNSFIRSRAKQIYCNHLCQVAAGMRRHRKNRKKQEKTSPNSSPASSQSRERE